MEASNICESISQVSERIQASLQNLKQKQSVRGRERAGRARLALRYMSDQVSASTAMFSFLSEANELNHVLLM